MFTQKDLRELVDYQSSSAMLSVYLNTDPSLGNADAYRLRLRTMLKSVDNTEDINRILRFFETEYDWTGKSVALFSDVNNDFFRFFPLAVPVQDLIYVGERANLRPLTGLLDSYGGYGVVLLDKQGARLFHFHLGELKEQEGVLGEEVRQSKGSGSAMTGMRGGAGKQARVVEETVERNIKEIVDFSIRFFEQKHVRRIILCGAEDTLALYKSYLPKAWLSLIVGSFPAAMTASNTEILNRAMEVGLEAERKREDLLVDQLITNHAKNAAAVMGINQTLDAVNSGRVKTLVVHHGYTKSGHYCADCNLITISPQGTCSVCGNGVKSVDDVVSLAINTTMKNGGDIEIVQAHEGLFNAGKIGAFLRY
ncbi:MAG: hypothetical protein CL609_24530 [Anaerolineaceae bacterium]|nr:hypothetical protein [Anaerolineaceae bacterium]